LPYNVKIRINERYIHLNSFFFFFVFSEKNKKIVEEKYKK